eukprot:GILJ01003190.1.p1 GENE.GILJ01003190.1~~GILJ01003190.1.p1  ORF type:complete len:777 (+),score=93.96 GILJ01003190.1:39-2369(+)
MQHAGGAGLQAKTPKKRVYGNIFDIDVAKGAQRHNFLITDLYSNLDDVEDLPNMQLEEAYHNHTHYGKFKAILATLNSFHWLYLMLLGIFLAILTLSIDVCETYLLGVRSRWTHTLSWEWNFFVWTGWCLTFSLASTAVCHFISKGAEGSGIPELKAILSGVVLPQYLTKRTLVAKCIGLALSRSSGLIVGKEGPFVHIGAALSNNLMKSRFFPTVKKNSAIYQTMLAAGVAAGVAAAFGTPVGGVMFSIETTSSFYMVSNLWKALFSCLCASMTWTVFHRFGYKWVEPFSYTNYDDLGWNVELIYFAILGLCCGGFGSGIVHYLSKVILFRKTTTWAWVKDRWKWVTVVALITSLLTFPTNVFRYGDTSTVNDMWSKKDFPLDNAGSGRWTEYVHQVFSMFYFIFVRLIVTAIAVVSPLPAGVFAPFFTLGAVFGRWYAEVIRLVVHLHTAGPYGVAGAAGVIAAMTHACSPAIVVFEMTGQMNYLLPILLTTLIAYAVGSSLSLSYFDLVLDLRGLPYLPALQDAKLYYRTAGDIMNRDVTSLQRGMTWRDAARVAQRASGYAYLPIVDANGMLLGTVKRTKVDKIVKKEITHNSFFKRSSFMVQMLKKRIKNTYHMLDIKSSKETTPLALTEVTVHSATPSAFLSPIKESDNEANSMPPTPYEDNPRNLEDEEEEEEVVVEEVEQQNVAEDPESMHPQEVRQEGVRDPLDEVLDLSPNSPLRIDWAPFQVVERTPVARVHYLFTMLGLAQVHITRHGQLVGILSKKDLLQAHV